MRFRDRQCDHVRKAMPASYAATVLLWSIPFTMVVLMLVCFYGGILIGSVSGLLNEFSHPSHGNGPLFSSLLGMITGLYLSVIIAKALMTVRQPLGVRVPPGAFPQLEELVGDCASIAGIEPPEGIFIVPEARAEAYSSGRLSFHGSLNHYVLIGAPLLVTLELSDIAAVIFHELGHLILRRDSWAISLHHKIEDFLTRCQRAQLQWQGCASVLTFAPAVVVALFLMAYRLSLARFSHREEKLADGIAGILMGELAFRERLVRSITTLGALAARIGSEPPLVEQMNAEFHRQMMAGNGVVDRPNYFAIARKRSVEIASRWDERLARVYKGIVLITSKSHPSLADRVRSLHGVISPELPLRRNSPLQTLTIPTAVETLISTEFCSEMRAVFFKAKLADGWSPLEGMSSESIVNFVCRYEGCPRKGQLELAVTRQELYLITGEDHYRLPWHEIDSVAILAGNHFNPFVGAIQAFGAGLREASSHRVLQLRLTNGGRIDFPHWHVLDNTLEVEALVKELWRSNRARDATTGELTRPVPDASATVAPMSSASETRAAGCLALLLKIVCATAGYLLPLAILTAMTFLTGDYMAFANGMGLVTVIGFCTGAVGWQLGNRIALRYFFSKPYKQQAPRDELW